MAKKTKKTTKRSANAKAAAVKQPAATPEKPPRLSCLGAAAQVLRAQGEPMNCKAMVEVMAAKKLWTSDAPTPAATLSSAILREMKRGADSRFKKTGRGLFAFNG